MIYTSDSLDHLNSNAARAIALLAEPIGLIYDQTGRESISVHQQLEVRNLIHFLKLAEHTSISAAAESLGMAQPSLSSSILKLEQMLNVQLVIRSARGVKLTAAGAVLVAEGRALVKDLDAVVKRVQSIGQTTETIRIALVPAIAQILTIPLAETAEIEHSEILLQVTQGFSGQILRMLQEDRADVGCVYEIKDPANFIFHPLMTEELFLVTAPDNWPGELDETSHRFEPVLISQLADLPLVMPSNMHGGRSTIIERAVERRGVRPNIMMQIDALPQIVEMIERASAYSILPHAAVVNQLAAGRVALVPFKDHKLTRTAYLVRERSKPLNKNTITILNTLAMVADEVVRRLDLAVTIHPTTFAQPHSG